MKEVGLHPKLYRLAARNPKTALGYIEIQIEQRPILEQVGQACGVVSDIAGQLRYRFEVEGTAEHVGTVPVPLRKNALVETSKTIHTIEQIALEHQIVATVGSSLYIFKGKQCYFWKSRGSIRSQIFR